MLTPLLQKLPGALPTRQPNGGVRCAAERQQSKPGCEVSICVNKTCKKQGSSQILQFARDLHIDGFIVTPTGCLGRCGNGPNIAVSPPDVVLNHMATPARFAEAMRLVAGADVSDAVLRTTELRLAGNAQARQGDLQAACACYTEALDLARWDRACSCGAQDSSGSQRHLLLANRSGALLTLGDHRGALRDAGAAVECGPADFHTACVRQVEAHAALKDYEAAAEALLHGGERDPAFVKTAEYKNLNRQLSKLNRQAAGA